MMNLLRSALRTAVLLVFALLLCVIWRFIGWHARGRDTVLYTATFRAVDECTGEPVAEANICISDRMDLFPKGGAGFVASGTDGVHRASFVGLACNEPVRLTVWAFRYRPTSVVLEQHRNGSRYERSPKIPVLTFAPDWNAPRAP